MGARFFSGPKSQLSNCNPLVWKSWPIRLLRNLIWSENNGSFAKHPKSLRGLTGWLTGHDNFPGFRETSPRSPGLFLESPENFSGPKSQLSNFWKADLLTSSRYHRLLFVFLLFVHQKRERKSTMSYVFLLVQFVHSNLLGVRCALFQKWRYGGWKQDKHVLRHTSTWYSQNRTHTHNNITSEVDVVMGLLKWLISIICSQKWGTAIDYKWW